MRISIYTTLAAVLFAFMGMAQAVLPTSWSFTTATLPVGWTQSGTGFYTASGNTPPAMKFDGTGDYLVINFASAPGSVTYFITGNSFSGGTFTVEESDLGTVWTTLHSFTAPPNGTYTSFTDTPQSTSRYIRFIYTNKVAGNIGLDDVSITEAAAGPEQEINVKYASTTIPSGGEQVVNSGVGVTTTHAFLIENLGTVNDLNISNAVVTGPDAADFSVAGFPNPVAAGASGNLNVDFTPSSAGTKHAVLTITSDDADEASYVINLYGIGGTLASEPTAQATNLTFSNVKTYRFNGSFTNASPAPEGYIVLRKKGSAITGVPQDGVVYKRGDIIGDAQVVFSGDMNNFVPNNIVASTQYYFAVYAYNGPNSYRNYLTTNPLTSSVTTPATMLTAGYYNGINTSSNTFVADLHNLVNPHQMQYYSNYATYMVRMFAARDTTDDRRVVTCVYSGENKIYSEPFDFTANGYSREHTYPHSWMPTNPAQDFPEYNDYHHLYPVNQNNANALRSNYPLGEVVTPSQTFLGCKLGLDASGNMVFEPRDEHKGDAARALMYEAICYTTVSGNSWAFPDPISTSINYGQNQDILKQWHFADMPDSWEISRNDFVDSLQGNRNPFIDSVDFACYVNFYQMNYEQYGCSAGLEEALNKGFVAYPNPANTELALHVDGTSIVWYEITDMQGRVVRTADVNNKVLVKINVADLHSGTYIVKALTPYGTAQKSIVIE